VTPYFADLPEFTIVKCVHLNGTLYFYHQGKRIITECDIYDPDILEDIIDDAEGHLEFLEDADLPDDLEIEIIESGDSSCRAVAMYSYSERKGYMASDDGSKFLLLPISTLRLISFSSKELDDSPGGMYSFWYHLERYPVHRTYLSPNIETEFLDALAYCANGECSILIF
jgi:hypothetical protein